MAADPVCGMTVSSDGRFRHLHEGQTYLFCSAKCLTEFQSSPADYLKPRNG
jgi:Cu+-exporting ATPase